MNMSQGVPTQKKSLLNRALVLGFATLCAMPAAQAGFIDHGNYTEDTTTNLDWLDVGETLNMSRADVAIATGTGGILVGWQYATLGDFTVLAREILGNPNYQGDSNSNATLPQATQFIDILGGPTQGNDQIYFMLAGTLIGGASMNSNNYWINGQLGGSSAASSWYGSLLIRTHVASQPTQNVPEPGMLAMLGLGIAGLIGTRRLRK
jgi:hypothetical protein